MAPTLPVCDAVACRLGTKLNLRTLNPGQDSRRVPQPRVMLTKRPEAARACLCQQVFAVHIRGIFTQPACQLCQPEYAFEAVGSRVRAARKRTQQQVTAAALSPNLPGVRRL